MRSIDCAKNQSFYKIDDFLFYFDNHKKHKVIWIPLQKSSKIIPNRKQKKKLKKNQHENGKRRYTQAWGPPCASNIDGNRSLLDFNTDCGGSNNLVVVVVVDSISISFSYFKQNFTSIEISFQFSDFEPSNIAKKSLY